MSDRATWKGVLKIALVTIPIKVYPATESSATISLNQLHSTCKSRIQQPRVCRTCEREVPSSEIVKGFEFEKDKYVVLEPEELDAIQPPSTRVIDLVSFAPAASLPWTAIDRAYYLVPDGPEPGPAHTAYALLLAAIDQRIGIGTLAIYGREYLVAVGGGSPRCLLLYTLHQAAELRPAPYVSKATTEEVKGRTWTLARQLVAALTKSLDLAASPDAYQADLRRLIDAKIAGEEYVASPACEPPAIGNLSEALQASVAAVSSDTKVSRDPLTKAARTARRRREAS
jgi:DNA end-binding protein Ku